MVMFFEKPSLRTRLTFEAGSDEASAVQRCSWISRRADWMLARP